MSRLPEGRSPGAPWKEKYTMPQRFPGAPGEGASGFSHLFHLVFLLFHGGLPPPRWNKRSARWKKRERPVPAAHSWPVGAK